eukprot:PhM_4_TR16252/c0_g2_i1/m.87147
MQRMATARELLATRGFNAGLARSRQSTDAHDAEENVAARKIQGLARSRSASREVKDRQRNVEKSLEEENQVIGVSIIQNAYRDHRLAKKEISDAKKQLSQLKEERNRKRLASLEEE